MKEEMIAAIDHFLVCVMVLYPLKFMLMTILYFFNAKNK